MFLDPIHKMVEKIPKKDLGEMISKFIKKFKSIGFSPLMICDIPNEIIIDNNIYKRPDLFELLIDHSFTEIIIENFFFFSLWLSGRQRETQKFLVYAYKMFTPNQLAKYVFSFYNISCSKHQNIYLYFARMFLTNLERIQNIENLKSYMKSAIKVMENSKIIKKKYQNVTNRNTINFQQSQVSSSTMPQHYPIASRDLTSQKEGDGDQMVHFVNLSHHLPPQVPINNQKECHQTILSENVSLNKEPLESGSNNNADEKEALKRSNLECDSVEQKNEKNTKKRRISKK